ncbi:MAG: glutathione S-transferase [Bacteriovorax sp.]
MKYLLYYWDVPFRGVFPQLFLEEVGAKYEYHDASEIYPKKSLEIHNPGMAPPYLFDIKNDRYLAQMPAILIHLAKEYDYLPKRTETADLALKIILDCHDILTEITNNGGQLMWNQKEWKDFRSDRLPRWMKIFERTGLEHGLKKDKGFLLGSRISVADISTTALFGTMIYSFPELKNDFKKNAPHVSDLCERIEARPMIKPFLEKQREKYGRTYCGGKIEKSLREVIQKKQLSAVI